MAENQNNLIWIDLEMTGLDPERIALSKSLPWSLMRILIFWQKDLFWQSINLLNSLG